jgi:hypothetical protein
MFAAACVKLIIYIVLTAVMYVGIAALDEVLEIF